MLTELAASHAIVSARERGRRSAVAPRAAAGCTVGVLDAARRRTRVVGAPARRRTVAHRVRASKSSGLSRARARARARKTNPGSRAALVSARVERGAGGGKEGTCSGAAAPLRLHVRCRAEGCTGAHLR